MESKYVVYLFGTSGYKALPQSIEDHLSAIIQQTNGNVEFFVGDGAGIDSAYHQVLSRLGASDKTTVYSMDEARHNSYGFKVKAFHTEYDPKTFKAYITYNDEILETFEKVNKPEELIINPNYYSFLAKQMIKDCTFAICLWDGESKVVDRSITRLSAISKYCYIYKVG